MNWKRKWLGIKAAGLALLMALVPVSGANAASWGPARDTYTNEKPAASATFNSITNNAAVGDERAFVRIAEYKSGNKLTNSLNLEAGKKYVVSIYYHNDASESTNFLTDSNGDYLTDANGNVQAGPGVALDVRAVSSFPTELKAGETKEVTGKIMSSNATPKAVWAGADVTALQDMTIAYVADSATIYNGWATNRAKISRYLFTDEGAFLGLDKLNGVILGCDRYSGQVTYILQTTAVDKPTPDPEPEPDPDPDPEPDPEPEPEPEPLPTPDPTPDPLPDPEPTPEVPEELPHTGPIEIIFAVLIGAAIIAGVIYWWRTHRAVKKTTKKAKGKR